MVSSPWTTPRCWGAPRRKLLEEKDSYEKRSMRNNRQTYILIVVRNGLWFIGVVQLGNNFSSPVNYR